VPRPTPGSSLNSPSHAMLHNAQINAKVFGATGDGVADDTTELQAAIDALVSATDSDILLIPAGTYKITSTLTLPSCSNKVILGASGQETNIIQYTNNIPILQATEENTHHITLDGFGLHYNSQQTGTNAVGLLFDASTALVSGWYRWKLNDMSFKRCHTGIYCPAGPHPFWGSILERVDFDDSYRSAIWLPAGNGGYPRLIMKSLYVSNGGQVPTAATFDLSGVEVDMEGIIVTNWKNFVFEVNGTMSRNTCRGLHIEDHTLADGGIMFRVQDGPWEFEDVSITSETDNGTNSSVFNVGAAPASVTVRGLSASFNNGGVSNVDICSGSSGGTYRFLDYINANADANTFFPGRDAATIQKVRMLDGVRPQDVISPAQLVANTNDWNPTDLAKASFIRLSTDASRDITGIVGGSSLRELTLLNVGAFNAVLKHDVTSTAANRFLCPGSADFTLTPNARAILLYDSTSSRWRVK
jgi:Pectate lyase superfamily protein